MIIPEKKYCLAEIKEEKLAGGLVISTESKTNRMLLTVKCGEEMFQYKKGTRVYVKSDAKLYPVENGKYFLLSSEDIIGHEEK